MGECSGSKSMQSMSVSTYSCSDRRTGTHFSVRGELAVHMDYVGVWLLRFIGFLILQDLEREVEGVYIQTICVQGVRASRERERGGERLTFATRQRAASSMPVSSLAEVSNQAWNPLSRQYSSSWILSTSVPLTWSHCKWKKVSKFKVLSHACVCVCV